MDNNLGQSHNLKKVIKLRHAVALYVSSVLGSGVLVLPGLAAQIAGPASLVGVGHFGRCQLSICIHVCVTLCSQPGIRRDLRLRKRELWFFCCSSQRVAIRVLVYHGCACRHVDRSIISRICVSNEQVRDVRNRWSHHVPGFCHQLPWNRIQ